MKFGSAPLATVAQDLQPLLTGDTPSPALHDASEIRRETVWVAMRDGTRLATDLYLPPVRPAPALVIRSPYGRARLAANLLRFAGHGYVVVSQDCRGTGDSEPDYWDYYVYERDDSFDCVGWIAEQEWFGGFLGSLGGSYVAGTQWCMAMHPSMSAIAPEVGGLGVVPITRPPFHMFVSAYSRSVGKGGGKIPLGYEELERRMHAETLAGGRFNEPLFAPFSDALVRRYPLLGSLPPADGQRWLYAEYSGLSGAERAELIKLALGEDIVTCGSVEALPKVFGHHVCHDAHMVPHPDKSELASMVQAPALLITGWYDWCLDDTLATWTLLTESATESVRQRSRLLITPAAHKEPGYHEGEDHTADLTRSYRTEQIVDLLLHWNRAVREDALDSWPPVIYYLMGANEWHAAGSWPPEAADMHVLYLGAAGALDPNAPTEPSAPDTYVYDPEDPTPTVGGSIVSSVLTPGSVDVGDIQQRPDVLTYTTPPLKTSLDVVGPLRLILYASSSAVDTDFSARLSDVFPDGRAIQLQSGTLRARYRDRNGNPQLLEPGRTYPFEIDMWATANRFAAGHRLRLDVSSADFPKFDRNANRGGGPGPPIAATQTVYHDPQRPSRLILSVMGPKERDDAVEPARSPETVGR